MKGSIHALKAQKPSQKVRALFREVARDIIARDRHARRIGVSQNTIAEIERAMAKAFAFDQEVMLNGEKSPIGSYDVDWPDVPPRSRETLASMTFGLLKRFTGIVTKHDRSPEIEVADIERFVESGRIRWSLVRNNVRSERSVADGSAAPLIRLGLLHSSSEDTDRFRLTHVGLQLCREYWRRSDADDPTLPRISLR